MNMETVILNILCEGQTEERFAKEVLKPYLKDRGIIVKYRQLITNKKKSIHGGMLSYIQAKNDLLMWMKQNCNQSNARCYYTTMFDFYALPCDFPGYEKSKSVADTHQRLRIIEEAFAEDIGKESFIPYIQLHEFEALVFCGLDKLQSEYPDCKKGIKLLKDILERYNNDPEAIDNSPHTAPSKRIIKALQGKYNYNKSQSGAAVTKNVGIETLRTKCRHFDQWISKIEKVVTEWNLE